MGEKWKQRFNKIEHYWHLRSPWLALAICYALADQEWDEHDHGGPADWMALGKLQIFHMPFTYSFQRILMWESQHRQDPTVFLQRVHPHLIHANMRLSPHCLHAVGSRLVNRGLRSFIESSFRSRFIFGIKTHEKTPTLPPQNSNTDRKELSFWNSSLSIQYSSIIQWNLAASEWPCCQPLQGLQSSGSGPKRLLKWLLFLGIDKSCCKHSANDEFPVRKMLTNDDREKKMTGEIPLSC